MPRSARFTTTHDLLKKQALALFLEKGYEQTSIQEITERAGLAVGSFYRHFPCKEEIFVEIWDEYAGSGRGPEIVSGYSDAGKRTVCG